MRRLILAMAALVVLGGCVETLQGAYNEQARTRCERDSGPRDRGDCLDRVEQSRRDRD